MIPVGLGITVAVKIESLKCVPARPPENGAVLFAVHIDGAAGKRISGIFDQAVRSQRRHICIHHKLIIRLQFPVAVKILDQQQRVDGFHIHPVIKEHIVKLLQVKTVIRYDDDPGVVIDPPFFQAFHILTQHQQGRHIRMVVSHIKGQVVAVKMQHLAVHFLIRRNVDPAVVRHTIHTVVRQGQERCAVRRIVADIQEVILVVIPDLRDLRHILQCRIAFPERLFPQKIIAVRRQIAAGVIDLVLQKGRHAAEQTVEYKVALPGFQIAFHAVSHGQGAAQLKRRDVRILPEHLQIRHRLPVYKRRIRYRHVIAFFPEHDRHGEQRLVVLLRLGELFFVEISFHCGIVIAAVQSRCTGGCMGTEGQCIRIVGKTFKLLLQKRLFVHNVRNKTSDRAVQHDDQHVLPVLTERQGISDTLLFHRHALNALIGGQDILPAHKTQ